MKNIIKDNILGIKAENLKPLSLYESLFDTKKINDEEKKLLIKRGEIYLTKDFPSLSFKLYREYKLTGNRENFQTVVDNRRFALNDVFFAELAENKGRFIDLIIEFLYETFSEIVWWLPAHNVYERDGYNSGYPDSTNPIIALFCAETAAQISIIVKTFEDKLPKELINIAIKQLDERIFIPFEKNNYWWMAKEGDFVNNWAPWCTQNVLIAYAFYLRFNRERMLNFITKSSTILDCFINSYGDDGCCEEGPQYYHVAGGALFGAIEIINLCSSNKVAEIYKNKKIYNIASYIYKVHISGPYYVNFGDSNAKAGDCVAKDYLFAKRVNNIELMDFITINYKDVKDKLNINQRNLFDRYLSIKYNREIEERMIKSFNLIKKSNSEFKSKGIYIFRDINNTLAVQAGSNDVSHNHNDTGSFIYYKNGKPLFIDVGVEEYSEKSFSKDRYSIWTMRSTYHNLSNFVDCEQRAGKNTDCNILEKTENLISMQLNNAYPKDCCLKSYIRTLILKNNELTIEDKVDCKDIATLTLMVEDKPTIINYNLIRIGTIDIKIISDIKAIDIETINIEDSRLKVSLPPTIYRILFKYYNEIKIIV